MAVALPFGIGRGVAVPRQYRGLCTALCARLSRASVPMVLLSADFELESRASRQLERRRQLAEVS